jgi:hypothetical protein
MITSLISRLKRVFFKLTGQSRVYHQTGSALIYLIHFRTSQQDRFGTQKLLRDSDVLPTGPAKGGHKCLALRPVTAITVRVPKGLIVTTATWCEYKFLSRTYRFKLLAGA